MLMIEKVDNLILGGGISGLGASYALSKRGKNNVIVEKESTYGGLCSSFEINGFTFDKFVHFSFSANPIVNQLFKDSVPDTLHHIPNPYNYYFGCWLRYPAYLDIKKLPNSERERLMLDFINREHTTCSNPSNYEEWLRWSFGDYYAEKFPLTYAKKYWIKEAKEMRTEWIQNRISRPSIADILPANGTSAKEPVYYAKELRYPMVGGYGAFLKSLRQGADIRYNKEVIGVDINNKEAYFSDGSIMQYRRLISSLPIPELIKIIKDVPSEVTRQCSRLEFTSGYYICVAFKSSEIPQHLWWYIYDDDILASRVSSPSLQSPLNAPDGCSSIQIEVFCKGCFYEEKELVHKTIDKLVEKRLIKRDDILFYYIGFAKYANIIFSKPIFDSRQYIRNFLKECDVDSVGRYGEWDYFWSDQSLLSGLSVK